MTQNVIQCNAQAQVVWVRTHVVSNTRRLFLAFDRHALSSNTESKNHIPWPNGTFDHHKAIEAYKQRDADVYCHITSQGETKPRHNECPTKRMSTREIRTLANKQARHTRRNAPRCRDCFDLSRAAVDKRVERVFTREVFPESTCPRIPTLMLITSSGLGIGGFADDEAWLPLPLPEDALVPDDDDDVAAALLLLLLFDGALVWEGTIAGLLFSTPSPFVAGVSASEFAVIFGIRCKDAVVVGIRSNQIKSIPTKLNKRKHNLRGTVASFRTTEISISIGTAADRKKDRFFERKPISQIALTIQHSTLLQPSRNCLVGLVLSC